MLHVSDPVGFGFDVAAALFAGILGCIAFGRWIGKRALVNYGEAGSQSIGSLEAAVFALMGLLIAFTFSGALERFDVRRTQVVTEANVIGTAWLRLDLLPAEEQPKIREAFRAYVDSRIATYSKLPDVEAALAELARSHALQSDIWRLAVAAATRPQNRPGTEGQVLATLNEMFDVATTRFAATQMHPPPIVYAMLMGLALAAALLAGYRSAGEKAIDWMHQLSFAAIVSLTVYVILDIEYPRLGLVRMDKIDQLLVNVRAGMK